jgi:pimeloyl-ACP methyl ester carboxylesterase
MFALNYKMKNNILLEKVTIGGITQWISLYGDAKNEICLFLHGGPGLAEMPLMNDYCKPLTETLLLVNWDQRGAGKSYSPFIPIDSMNLNQFINDALEVILYLKLRFKKEKIILMGHSWGSALGMLLVKKCPEHLYAYIGIGQIGNWHEGEKISYQYTLKKAQELGNNRALRKLKNMEPPPHTWKMLISQRQILLKLGGSIHNRSNYNSWIPKYLFSKEYSIIDLLKYLLGIRFSLKHLWADFTKIDLLKEVPEVQIPIFFLLGKHDYQVPFECSIVYFEHLKAPLKEIFLFEKSGHSPMFEETDKFIEIVKQCINKIK